MVRQAPHSGVIAARPRVLLVGALDDVRALRDYLELMGFTVTTAGDVAESIAEACATAPRIIVFDLSRTIIDELRVVAAFKRNEMTRFAPIIALGEVDQELEARVRAAGCDDYITKPYVVHELFALLMRHLRAAARGEPIAYRRR